MIDLATNNLACLTIKDFSPKWFTFHANELKKIFKDPEGSFWGDYDPNISLWKRVIAWQRSRATSGYGIIWGDADQNKQEEFSAECHSVDWFNRTTDSNKIEVIVLDDQKSRELRRIRTTGLAVYLDDCMIL